MSLGKRGGGYCTSRRGARAAETIGADLAPGGRGVPGASMGDGRGQAGLEGSHPGPEASFAVLGLAVGGLGPTQGPGHIGEGEGGLETRRGAAEMSGEVHCEGWQLPVRRSAAAIGCPPSCIFMYIHECAAPNGAAVRPAVPTDPLLRPRVPSPTRRLCLCAASCRQRAPGSLRAPSTVCTASLAWHNHVLPAMPCRELVGPGASLPRRIWKGQPVGFSHAHGAAGARAPSPLLAPCRALRCPSFPLGAAAPLLAAFQSQAEIIFSGVDQLCKAVGKTVTQRQTWPWQRWGGEEALLLLRGSPVSVPQGCCRGGANGPRAGCV